MGSTFDSRKLFPSAHPPACSTNRQQKIEQITSRHATLQKGGIASSSTVDQLPHRQEERRSCQYHIPSCFMHTVFPIHRNLVCAAVGLCTSAHRATNITKAVPSRKWFRLQQRVHGQSWACLRQVRARTAREVGSFSRMVFL